MMIKVNCRVYQSKSFTVVTYSPGGGGPVFSDSVFKALLSTRQRKLQKQPLRDAAPTLSKLDSVFLPSIIRFVSETKSWNLFRKIFLPLWKLKGAGGPLRSPRVLAARIK